MGWGEPRRADAGSLGRELSKTVDGLRAEVGRAVAALPTEFMRSGEPWENGVERMAAEVTELRGRLDERDDFICRLRGEIAQVTVRHQHEGVANKVEFHAKKYHFRDRPMKGEYVKVYGVEFRIKRITHDPPHLTIVKLEPATVENGMWEEFTNCATVDGFTLKELH